MINLKIKTQNNEFEIQTEPSTNLKKVLADKGINFRFPCGGKGKCGHCKVTVTKGLESPTKVDEMKLKKDELDAGKRLACCLNLNKDMEIELKETEINFLD